MTQNYIDSLKASTELYERQAGLAGAFCDAIEGLSISELESTCLSLQKLYLKEDISINTRPLIDISVAFQNWEQSNQSLFISYLSAKIALLREAETR